MAIWQEVGFDEHFVALSLNATATDEQLVDLQHTDWIHENSSRLELCVIHHPRRVRRLCTDMCRSICTEVHPEPPGTMRNSHGHQCMPALCAPCGISLTRAIFLTRAISLTHSLLLLVATTEAAWLSEFGCSGL